MVGMGAVGNGSSSTLSMSTLVKIIVGCGMVIILFSLRSLGNFDDEHSRDPAVRGSLLATAGNNRQHHAQLLGVGSGGSNSILVRQQTTSVPSTIPSLVPRARDSSFAPREDGEKKTNVAQANVQVESGHQTPGTRRAQTLFQELALVEKQQPKGLVSRFDFQKNFVSVVANSRSHQSKKEERPHHYSFDATLQKFPLPIPQGCPSKARPDQFCTANLGRDWKSDSGAKVFPITYSLPEELFVEKAPGPEIKDQDSSIIIPRVKAGYKFTKQSEYRFEYTRSYYCMTYKKGGWDALRHYEIIAAGCMPYVPDLEYAPVYTMYHFPKQLVLEARNLPGVYFNCSTLRVSIDHQVFPKEKYFQLLQAVIDHARQHLTTKAMAKYVLRAAGVPEAKKVLYFVRAKKGVQLRAQGNYNSWTLFHGLRSLLGTEGAIDYEVISFMYNQSAAMKESLRPRLYGQGFGYAFMLPEKDGDSKHSTVDRSNIGDRIKKKEFDLIIYGDPTLTMDRNHRSWIYYDEYVRKFYSKDQILFLHATDIPYPQSAVIGYPVEKLYSLGTVFQREIMDCRYYAPPATAVLDNSDPEKSISMSESQAMKRCIWYVNKNCFDDVNTEDAMKSSDYRKKFKWDLLAEMN